MDYILSGDEREVGKVIQENRIRINRGVIKFTPVEAGDSKEVAKTDIKEVTDYDSKEADTSVDTKEVEAPKKKSSKK